MFRLKPVTQHLYHSTTCNGFNENMKCTKSYEDCRIFLGSASLANTTAAVPPTGAMDNLTEGVADDVWKSRMNEVSAKRLFHYRVGWGV